MLINRLVVSINSPILPVVCYILYTASCFSFAPQADHKPPVIKNPWCMQVCAHLIHMRHVLRSYLHTSVSIPSCYHGSRLRQGVCVIIEVKMMDELQFEESSGKRFGSCLRGLTGTKASRRETGTLKTWDQAVVITKRLTARFSLSILLSFTYTVIVTKPTASKSKCQTIVLLLFLI